MATKTDEYVCPYCKVGWTILPHELHCGFCARRVFDYEVTLENKLLYSDNSVEERLNLKVTNTGLRPIQFAQISTSPQNAIQALKDISRGHLQPNRFYNISLRVNTKAMPSNKGTVTVTPKNGNLKAETHTVPILPAPKFEIFPQPETAKEAIAPICGKNKTTQVEFNLRVLESQFFIDEIECDEPWVKKIRFPEELCLKKGDRQYPIKVDVDCNDLDIDTSHPTMLKFKLRSRHDWIDKPITIKPQLMPQLSMIPTSDEAKIVEGKTAPHSISVKNIGGGELFVQSVIENAALLKQSAPGSLRLNVDQTGTLDFQIDARDVKPGIHNIQVTIHSNCCENTNQTYLLTVEVEEQTEHDYYIAIDFGTTNSCCAYIDESDKFKIKLVQLEPPPEGLGEWDEVIPSTIIYGDNYSGKPYRVGIHAEVDRIGRNAPYYVTSAKRWLGYNWRRQFPISGTFEHLEPREVVRDTIQYLVSRVEDYLNQKVRKCVISHPTMFSRRQVEDLKWALEEIGFDSDNIKMIDEASAAALDYIYSRKEERDNQPDSYTILVYDFGGGTIDIVLSKVTVTEDGIAVEPLSWGGNPRFGGDNVTQFIVDLIVDKCAELVKKAIGSDVDYKIPYLKPNQTFRATGNTDIDNAIRRNSAQLYYQANSMKIDLTGEPEVFDIFNQSFVIIQNEAKRLEEILEDASARVEITREELEKSIQPRLEETIRKIDEMVKETAQVPDFVILAGQSSKMPIVEKLIKEYFDKEHSKGAEIRLAEEPKACVSKGAARYGATLFFPGSSPAEILDFSNKTHSRFGIVAVSEGGRFVFQEFVGSGKKIPDESFGKIDNYPLKRETVITVAEHLGTGYGLDGAEIIGKYTHKFPDKEVADSDLRKGQLEMQIKEDESIEVKACVADNEYTFNYQRLIPPFLEEIS